MAGPQCNFVDSIDSFDSSNGEFYWRSDKWSCRSENCISLVGLTKYFTLFLWQSPSVTLSIRSIRSIRQMENFIDDPTSGAVDRKIASHWWDLQNISRYCCGRAQVKLCRFDRFVRVIEWRILLTIRQVALSIGKLHLISGTFFLMFHDILLWQRPVKLCLLKDITSFRTWNFRVV